MSIIFPIISPASSPTQPLVSRRETANEMSAMVMAGQYDAGVEISVSSRLQSGRDTAIALGNRARETDATFANALDLVESMKSQLEAITKQFPPFATGSDERFQFLQNFSGLRAQIESLTFPPEPMATGEWSGAEFPPERLDWNLPFLDPVNASDAQVYRAETALAEIGQSIAKQRQFFHDSMISVTQETSGEEARRLSQNIRQHLAA